MHLSNGAILFIFVISIILFFWGSWKAMRTQKKIYLTAMLPLGLLIMAMFLI